MPNNPGIGGIQLSPANFGALIQAAAGSPFEQIMRGLTQGANIFEQFQQQAEDTRMRRAQMLEMQERMKQAQMQNAQMSWDQTISLLQKNPNLRSSPVVKQRLLGLSTQLGYTVPTDNQGNIDTSVFGTSFSEFMKDKDFQERWWNASPQGRKTMVDTLNISGVPDSAINAQQVLSAREQNLVDKYKLSSQDISDRIKDRDLLASAQSKLDAGKGALLTVEERTVMMRAQADQVNAAAHMKTADAAMKRADNEIRVAEMRARGHGTSDVLMRQLIGSAQRAHDRFKAEADGYSAQVKQMVLHGADAGSDAVQAVQQKATFYYEQARDEQTRLDTLSTEVSTQPGTTHAVQTQSGKTATVKNASHPNGSVEITQPDGKKAWLYPDGSIHPE